MAIDPILALQTLGYTDREAAFLYLVAAHSGYFLRRQFDYFVDRHKGSIVMRLLEKARASGHIESLQYNQGWFVYHLCSRSIYRLLGDSDSQSRRRKGDAQVRARLMALDYVLENDGDYFFSSADGKLQFFRETRGITPTLFANGDGQLLPLLASFPISLADRSRPSVSPVRFAFIDEGLSTEVKFLRFLEAIESLLHAIGSFEMVYVSGSEFNFHHAKVAFWSRFSDDAPRTRSLFDDETRSVAAQPCAKLQPRLTTMLLGYRYPPLQRSEGRGSARVRIQKGG